MTSPPRRPARPAAQSSGRTSPNPAQQAPVARSPRNLRAQVIDCLHRLLQGRSLSALLPQVQAHTAERDRALLHELVMGSARQWFALEAVLAPMLASPPKPIIQAALVVGSYQLLYTRIPAHAAISETVEAIKQLGQKNAAGLVNALLRRVLREQDSLRPALETHHGLPDWLATALNNDWPERFGELAAALRQSAPLFLRVNRRQRSRDAYLHLLHQQDIDAAPTHRPDGIVLLQSAPVTQLPGYDEGWFAIQDDHAQLCAELMGDLDGVSVLDACAAPGGKTCHLLERYTPRQLTALDSDAQRLQRVQDNLQRLQLTEVAPLTLKATNAATWQAPAPFDAILLDAPCTATGVLRRHPDIRLLRQADDVAQTVALQARLLNHLWLQLQPGGNLLYVTCSLLKAENEQQIAAFLARHPDAREVPIQATWGEARPHGRQCFPSADGGDGFYFCVLNKTPAP